MDSIVSAARHESVSRTRSLHFFALAAIAAALTGCGGGGGGGDDGGGGNPPPTPTGSIAATVEDQFGAPINGVTITAGSRSGTTGSAGTVTVTGVPTGSVSVTAHAEGLVDPPAQTVTVPDNGTANVSFTMDRVVEAAGGIRGAAPLSTNDDTTVTFRLRVIVIDENFNPVPNLQASAFTLADCAPVTPEFPERPDCVRFGSPGRDAAYTVQNAQPANFQEVADPPGPVPYAAGLLFDSSASIADSDPTDARIFATKEYLNDVASGGGDFVMLAAFADQGARQLPNEGVNYFPCDPCTPSFTSDGNSLFASLDELANLEGGGTPLYDSVQDMIITVDTEPVTPTNQAVVLFSDGRDIYCDDPNANPPGSFAFCTTRRRQVVEEAGAPRNVNIFTIGLASDNVDTLALAELALRDGGAFMFAERPTQLISIFGILDRLLADDVPSYQMEWTVNAAAGTFDPTPSNGDPAGAVIGQLTIDTGPSTAVTVPFAVQVR